MTFSAMDNSKLPQAVLCPILLCTDIVGAKQTSHRKKEKKKRERE